ncbi:DUF262 domain-containing protein [Bradyrhizobium sp. CB1717]|uniref:DUF262 domain-containing protein n=1 Tax=Bradyrhizobium sp. CB1717 TaxID=3039154 RepID=UPI0024B078D2|nr:DUF262 domain-containing protein [Bradyrhizobium sp. CB1717]WFU27239.1 DUF262 domain-containing protein [Bradyrhizobium sp. CB1717]
MQRKATFQSLSWLWDLYKRKLLDMDPPYQRRSIWNQPYKEFFIDTVLNDYPCPAIFLYENITPEGVAKYSVVDGKQRLLTLFEFANNEFAVSSESTVRKYRDKYFQDLDDDAKRGFWRYQFAVEFIPSEDETLINTIFDRINRNVAKLTRQELRHAKFSGVFITKVEDLSEWMFSTLPKNFPFIQASSRKQMRDDEFVSQLLLLLEEGPKSYSQDDLDQAFSLRDPEWERAEETEREFREVVQKIDEIVRGDQTGELVRRRLRNQADFYSLVGAISSLTRSRASLDSVQARDYLQTFIAIVEDEALRNEFSPALAYFGASRAASNDAGPRTTRITIMNAILTGVHTLPRV